MPKNSPTGDHLRARRYSDGETTAAAWSFGHPSFVPRLSWRTFAYGGAPDVARIAHTVAKGNVAVFIDSSVLTDDLDQDELWQPMLDGDATIMMTSQIIHESKAYLTKRRDTHPLVLALKADHSRVVFGADRAIVDDALLAREYYLTLLATRRRAVRPKLADHQTRTGAEPTPQDVVAMRQRLQQELGNRAVKLEKKSTANDDFADESLVFAAVEHALRTGQQVIILTSDWDIEEQFFKMMWLLETHHRSMLLGDMYATDLGRFQPRAMRSKRAQFYFDGDDNVWFPREADLRFVLPSNFTFVAISVLRVTDRTTQMTFGAETGMYRTFKIKARHDGRNTGRLGDRNIHASLAGIAVAGNGSDAAGVVRDRQLPTPRGRLHVAALDVVHALASAERHTSLQLPTNGIIVPGRHVPTPYPKSINSRPEPIRFGNIWLPYGTNVASLLDDNKSPETGGE